jgi:hypothetical protein
LLQYWISNNEDLQIIKSHNYAPGNAGVILWTDILTPVLGFALLFFAYRKKAAESGRIIAKYDPTGKTLGLEDYFDCLTTVGWSGYTRAHGVEKLYDLVSDPDETTNRINSSAYSPTHQKLRDCLIAWATEYGDTKIHQNATLAQTPFPKTTVEFDAKCMGWRHY